MLLLRSAGIWLHIRLHILLPLLPFNGLFFRTTWVSRYQKGRTILDYNEVGDDGWQWHQLHHIQIICTTLQTDNHASTSSPNYLRAGCSSCCPRNSVSWCTCVQSFDSVGFASFQSKSGGLQHCVYVTDLEGLLEQLVNSAKSSVAAAVATLKSAASMVREHTEQIRRTMEVTFELKLS